MRSVRGPLLSGWFCRLGEETTVKRMTIVAVSVGLMLAALLGGSAGSGTATARSAQQWTVPGQVLVRFRDAAPLAAIEAANASVGAQVVKSFEIVHDLQLVRGAGSTPDVAPRYQASPAVLYAQPNFV